jgi:hypothetical protein
VSRRLRQNTRGCAVAAVIGAVLVGVLGLTALLPYSLESATVHWGQGAADFGAPALSDTTSTNAGPQGVTTWQGKTILEVSLAVALLVCIAVAECLVLEPPTGGQVLDGMACLAVGWAGTALLWHLGLVIRGFRSPGGLMLASVRHYPGYGLWLGLVLAVVVAGLFSFVLGYRERQAWLGAGWAMGLLSGLALVLIELTAKA